MADAVLRVKADTTQAERALGNLQTALGALATVGAARALANIADVSTNLQNKLNTVAVAQGQVNETLQSIVGIARTARTPLADTGQLYFTIARAAGDLGVTNQEALRYTELLTKSMALSGTSGAAAAGALTQLGQALGQNSVRGDELNSILEGMPDLAIAMADKFGVTVGALKLLGQQGRITGRDLLDSVAEAANRIETNFSRAIPTISSAFDVLQTSITNFVGELDRATGGAGTAANTIIRIADSIDTLGKSIDTIVTILSIGFAIAIGIFAAKAVAAGGVITVLITGFIRFGSVLVQGFNMLRNGASSIGLIIKEFASLSSMTSMVRVAFNVLRENFGTFFRYIGGTAVAAYFANLFGLWDKLINKVKEYLGLSRAAVVADEAEVAALKEQQAAIQAALTADAERARKLTAKEIEDRETIRKAIFESEKTFKTMLRDSEQAVQLAGLQGEELERQTVINRFNNALVKEIYDSNGNLIGITAGLTREQERQVVALDAQVRSLERQKRLYEEIQSAGQTVVRAAAAGDDPRIKVEQDFINAKIALENYFVQNSLMTEEQYQQTLSQLTEQYQRDRISAEMQLTKKQYEDKFALDNAALVKSVEIFNVRVNQLKQLADLEFQNWNQELIRQDELFKQQQNHVQRRMEMQFNAANQEMILRTQIYDLEVQQTERLAAMRQSMFQQELQQRGFTLEQSKGMARDRAEFEKKSELEKTQFAISQTASIFDNLGKENRRAFEAAKAFNIANAVMNTYMGATKALATYPPPFNFIAAAAVVAAGLAQVASIRSQTYTGRALGGPIVGGQQYIVGERGPELITAPSGGGRVTANDQLGGTTNINFTIVANDARGFDQLLAERKGTIINMVRQAQQDRGRMATV